MSNTPADIKRLRERALAGDANAQNSLGCAYYNADGLSCNYAEAMAWYQKAAAQGNACAIGNIGLLYENGFGVERDCLTAAKWYLKAAILGNVSAQNNLGTLFERGYGVEKNLCLALYWFRNAALKGNAIAQRNVGTFFENGLGTRVNYGQARYWYQQSVKQGDARAKELLALLDEKHPSHLGEDICPLSINNPYRALGVYTNSSSREITANKAKAIAFAKVGKTIVFDADNYSEYIGIANIPEEGQKIFADIPPKRTYECINSAANLLADDKQRLKYAFFWFASVRGNSSSIDLNLKEKNLTVLDLVSKHYESFIQKSLRLLHQADYRNCLVCSATGDNTRFSEDELVHLFIDTLLEEMPEMDWLNIFKQCTETPDMAKSLIYLQKLLAKRQLHQIQDCINALTSCSELDERKYYCAILNLYLACTSYLFQLKGIIGQDSYEYAQACDNVAAHLLQLSQTYYVKFASTTYEVTGNCVEMASMAFELAQGSPEKTEIQESLDIIKKLYSDLPPKEIYLSLNRLYAKLNNHRATIMDAQQFVVMAAPALVRLKVDAHVQGKYIAVSTQVAQCALAIAIDQYNTAIDELSRALDLIHSNPRLGATLLLGLETPKDQKEEKLKQVVQQILPLLANLDLLAKTADFATRYESNKRTFLKQAKSFGLEDLEFIKPNIDIRTEDEIFKQCCCIQDFEAYLARFPHGKYSDKAQSQKEALGKQDHESWIRCAILGQFEQYLAAFPKGLHATQAETAISFQRNAETQSEKDFWSECEKHKAYRAYRKAYPKGAFLQEAAEGIIKRSNKPLIGTFVFVWMVIIVSLTAYFMGESHAKPHKSVSETPIENSAGTSFHDPFGDSANNGGTSNASMYEPANDVDDATGQ